MSIWMSASWLPNIWAASCFASLGLADAGGTDEQERTDRAARILQIGAGTAQGAGNRGRRDLLADDHLLDLALESEQSLALLLLHPGQRNAGPVGDDLHHQVLVDRHALLFARLLPLLGDLLLLGAELLLLVAETAASSKCCFAIASSFWAQTVSISFDRFSISGGRFSEAMRAREPASSITSMALSGRKRPVM
jgi:hypothetical protein